MSSLLPCGKGTFLLLVVYTSDWGGGLQDVWRGEMCEDSDKKLFLKRFDTDKAREGDCSLKLGVFANKIDKRSVLPV